MLPKTDRILSYNFNRGLSAAARLKALGIESVVLDRNAGIGDNWANRYDCVTFHLPTSSCELPYVSKLQ